MGWKELEFRRKTRSGGVVKRAEFAHEEGDDLAVEGLFELRPIKAGAGLAEFRESHAHLGAAGDEEVVVQGSSHKVVVRTAGEAITEGLDVPGRRQNLVFAGLPELDRDRDGAKAFIGKGEAEPRGGHDSGPDSRVTR